MTRFSQELEYIRLLSEVETRLIRPGDEARRMQLIGVEEAREARMLSFKKRCFEAYLTKTREELVRLRVSVESQTPEAIEQAVIEFLANHWEQVKRAGLYYTAYPEHPVTLLMIDLANALSASTGRAAITFLMPGVLTVSISKAYPDLTQLNLSEIVKTHILGDDFHYLLPVRLLLEATNTEREEAQILNPYFDEMHNPQVSKGYLSASELSRMYQHSESAINLRDTYKRYDASIRDSTHLLGQLTTLCYILSRNDAYTGIGTSTNAGKGAYSGIIAFMAYYRRLTQVGFYRSDTTPLVSGLSEGCRVGYVLGASGLYCVNRYDESVTQLCEGEAIQRYSLNLCSLETLEETLPVAISGSYQPIAVHVRSSQQYYLFYKQEGVWRKTEIHPRGLLPFPEQLKRRVTLAIGNVPNALYQAIVSAGIDMGGESTVNRLSVIWPEAGMCSPEQSLLILSEIEAHTGHCDLSAFKQVPEGVRKVLVDLWHYIQNPSINLSVTETTVTCIGNIKDALREAMRGFEDTLSAICVDEIGQKNHRYQTLQALESARSVFERDCFGVDCAYLMPEMVNYLGIPFSIQNGHDLEWLLTFPKESLQAFLSERSVSDYLKRYCIESLDNITTLLLTAPVSSYAWLIQSLQKGLGVIFQRKLGQVLAFLPDEKRGALIYALKDHLPRIIQFRTELVEVLTPLNEIQCQCVLNALKDRLPRFILFGTELVEVLTPLNEIQCQCVLNALKDHLPRIIGSMTEPVEVLIPLNATQRQCVLNALKDHLPKIIKSGYGLGMVLESLNKTQRKLVIQSLKSNLVEWAKTYQGSYINEVKQASEEVKYYNGFFSTRGSQVHWGNLSQKLELYISVRQKEYTFHWDILCIYTFINWLFGINNAYSKHSKCDAASYALNVANNARKPAFQIKKIDSCPENPMERDCYHSYLWNTQTSTLYYVDYQGYIRDLVPKNKEQLIAVMNTMFNNDRVVCEKTHEEMASCLQSHFSSLLPSTAIMHALSNGLLGNILSEEGGGEVFMAASHSL